MPLILEGDARPDPGRPDPAAKAIQTWRAIELALQPVLGRRGVDALYWRSLQLATRQHPWLADHNDPLDAPMDLSALASALAGQDIESAETGSRTMLNEFRALLVSLVGASLTDRLLASVPALHADTQNPQDNSP